MALAKKHAKEVIEQNVGSPITESSEHWPLIVSLGEVSAVGDWIDIF